MQDVSAQLDLGEGGLGASPKAAGRVGDADLQGKALTFALLGKGRPPSHLVAARRRLQEVDEGRGGLDARQDGRPLGEDLVVGPHADGAEVLGVVDHARPDRGGPQHPADVPLRHGAARDGRHMLADSADRTVAVQGGGQNGLLDPGARDRQPPQEALGKRLGLEGPLESRLGAIPLLVDELAADAALLRKSHDRMDPLERLLRQVQPVVPGHGARAERKGTRAARRAGGLNQADRRADRSGKYSLFPVPALDALQTQDRPGRGSVHTSVVVPAPARPDSCRFVRIRGSSSAVMACAGPACRPRGQRRRFAPPTCHPRLNRARIPTILAQGA